MRLSYSVRRLQLVLVLLLIVVANFALLPKAFAGTLTGTSVIELGGASNVSPMIAADGQSLAIVFTTASAGATSVSLNFGSAWTSASGAVTSGSTAVSNTGCTALTGATNGLPGSLTASGSGTTITISGVTALAASTSYCTELTSATAVTNPTAGVYSVTMTAGSDSQTDAIDVLSASANAYTITATVAPTFTLALTGAPDTFSSNLSSSALTTSTGVTATVNTNAASGWFLWAEDSNAGLKSASAGNHTIASVSTGSNHTMNGGTIGTEAYALGVATHNTTNYAYGSGTSGGGLSTSTFNEIATSNSPASNVTSVLHELADISSTTPPGTDYTDTITVIGAGSF